MYITEILASNTSYPNSDGRCCDYIELYNSAEYPLDLSGFQLGDVSGKSRYMFPAGTVIQPGDCLAVYCDKTVDGTSYAPFEINRAGGETFYLIAKNSAVVDEVTTICVDVDQSMVLQEDGQWQVSFFPTPGQANRTAPVENWDIYNPAVSPVRISEFSTAETGYLPQYHIRCDWIELYNPGTETADLSGFSISDDLDVPDMHKLKSGTLAPGETVVLLLSDEEGIAEPGFEQAMFTLDVQEDQLFLFDAAGNLLDYVHLKDIPLGHSYGRREDAGGFCYMQPSPQNPNSAGYRQISSMPVSSYVPGVYSQEDGFSLTLEAEGTIYYSADGSVPDASSIRYEAPLKIDRTTVIRAVAVEEGKMASDVYTATFIVGDSHELPVVSLVTDPEGLWGKDGIYRNGAIWVKETQLPAHLSYNGKDGSFAINCATNLHGATTVEFFDKKTFAVRFQDRFDGPLHYDVFEDGEVTDFSSLLIRTAHESQVSSQMHDALIGYIASQCSDTVLSQKYKYVLLYLNGEYWGLYALRERHSPEHYASYMHESAEDVQIVRFMIDE